MCIRLRRLWYRNKITGWGCCGVSFEYCSAMEQLLLMWKLLSMNVIEWGMVNVVCSSLVLVFFLFSERRLF